MPAPGETLRYLSLSQLAEVSGCSRATVRKRLAMAGLRPVREGLRSVWYAAPQAIEAILGEGLDPRAEKARLDKARADMEELKLAERRAQVAPRHEIARTWATIAQAARTAIRTIPERAQAQIPGFTKPMARKLLELLDATLVELDDGSEPTQ